MENIKIFHAITRGDSHIAKNMPCQDAVDTYEDLNKGVIIGALSDGHGSKEYFRSDVGSKILVRIAIDTLKAFESEIDKEVFQEKLITRGTLNSSINDVNPKQSINQTSSIVAFNIPSLAHNDQQINQIIKSIIARWHIEISEHWRENPPSEGQLNDLGLSVERIKLFLENTDIQIAYGCTLIAFLRTRKYWLVIQIGDGKCMAFDNEMNQVETIPNDPLCYGNITTSMCQDDAYFNFRYAYGNLFPAALFIASDGLDGCFSPVEFMAIESLKKLYHDVVESFLENGQEKGLEELNNALPLWSAAGFTKDDISLAAWIDYSSSNQLLKAILDHKIEDLKKKTEAFEIEILEESLLLNQFQEKIDQKAKELSEIEKKIDQLNNKVGKSQAVIEKYKESINSLKKQLQKNEKNQSEEQLRFLEDTLEQKALVLELDSLKKEINDLFRISSNKKKSISEKGEEKEKATSLLEILKLKWDKHVNHN